MKHWIWRLTHLSQWRAARRYERMTQPPPREWWDEMRKQRPTARYCRRHKRAEPLDSWCFNEGAPMSPARRARMMQSEISVGAPTVNEPRDALERLKVKVGRPFTVSALWPADIDGGYIVTVQEFPGVAGAGDTLADAVEDCLNELDCHLDAR